MFSFFRDFVDNYFEFDPYLMCFCYFGSYLVDRFQNQLAEIGQLDGRIRMFVG